jgi:hypothetical protein
MKTTTSITAKLAALFLFAAAFATGAQSVPSLVNYQGRLSKSDGTPLPTMDYQLTFNIYDATNGGNLVWGPQIFDGSNGVPGHGFMIPVVQGYFNVMLGPADTNGVSLANAFNATNRYVEIKVGTNNPILPRQQVLTAPFAFQAGNSAKLAGYDWGSLLNTNDPVNGKLGGGKLADASVTGAKLADGAITSNQIAAGTILGIQIASNTITLTNLVQRQGGTNVGVGGLAFSATATTFTTNTSSTSYFDIPGLVLTIPTSGRPLLLQLMPGDPTTNSYVRSNSSSDCRFELKLVRVDDGATVSIQEGGVGNASDTVYPSSAFSFLDLVSAGTHTYKLQGRSSFTSSIFFQIFNVKLIAYEL